ncbi:MAG: hypothetical protein NDF55_00385 [archaeon GB-1867-005]|nr:hypothetical protein [Candidatus Culexmicrobium cathedralense]
MAKIIQAIKAIILLIYLSVEVGLIYLKFKLWFLINRMRLVREFKKQLKKQGLEGDNLNELVKIYSKYLKEIEISILKQFKIK